MHPGLAHRSQISRYIALLFLIVSFIGLAPAAVGIFYMVISVFFLVLLPIPLLGLWQMKFFLSRACGAESESDSAWWVFVALYNSLFAIWGLAAGVDTHDLVPFVGWFVFLTTMALVAAVLDVKDPRLPL